MQPANQRRPPTSTGRLSSAPTAVGPSAPLRRCSLLSAPASAPGHLSPTAQRPSSGGSRPHRRGRRAGRIVQERRRQAIDAEQQRVQDYDRALIPLAGPVSALGTRDGSAAHTRDWPGLAANNGRQRDVGDAGPHRVGRHQSRTLESGRAPRCLVAADTAQFAADRGGQHYRNQR